MIQRPPRREHDAEEDDFTDRRRPITGDEQELSIGAGKYRLTARGGIVIIVIGTIAMLAMLAYGIREQDRAVVTMTMDHRRMMAQFDRTMRLQTCVLSMTPDERLQWRQSRDAQNALVFFCPGLLMSGVETP